MYNNSGLAEDRGDIGSTCNFWREPVYEISEEDRLLIDKNWRWDGLRISRQTWIKNSEAVDKILRLIVSRMAEKASNMYPGLVIDKNFTKQGSSREGLKIEDAREFDYILPFEINGLRFSDEVVRQFSNSCQIIPGLIKRRVHIVDSFDQRGWMRKNNILQEMDDGFYLNTKNLHKLVLTSILDSALDGINKKLKTLTKGQEEKYSVDRGVRPPTLQLKINIYGRSGVSGLDNTVTRMQYEGFRPESLSLDYDLIEVDLVPGMLLAVDKVPDPFALHMRNPVMMNCVRYGVMKWVNSPTRASQQHTCITDQDVLWRNSSCGYEKHMFDICRRNQSQRFIMTACRILKIALKRMSRDYPTNQIPSILKSYHLKNICLYCVLFLTIPSDKNRVSSVREALGYFVKYIELSLEAGFLPHFFHGNPWISQLFPGSPYEKEKVKCNLIQNVDLETMKQCRLGLHEFLNHTIYGLYREERRLDLNRIEKYRDLLR